MPDFIGLRRWSGARTAIHGVVVLRDQSRVAATPTRTTGVGRSASWSSRGGGNAEVSPDSFASDEACSLVGQPAIGSQQLDREDGQWASSGSHWFAGTRHL